MPRINRNTVVFEVDGKTYEAVFQHEHNEKGMVRTDALWIKHVTTCLLREKGHVAACRGVANCSMKDTYKWKVGIKLAFVRALEKAGMPPPAYGKKFTVLDKGWDTKEKWGKFMQAFFREMRTPPVNVKAASALPVIEGEVLTEEIRAEYAALDRLANDGGCHLDPVAAQRRLDYMRHIPQYVGHGMGWCGGD